MKKILITALGTMNASAIINALRKYDESFRLIGADIYSKESIANSLFVDEFYQFPRADIETDKYVNYLYDFCVHHAIDYCFCFIDEEVSALANQINRFNTIGTKICIPDVNTINMCHDKHVFVQWLQANMPKYCIQTYQSPDEIKYYPIFIKPKFGRASIGCKKVNSFSELKSLHIDWNKTIVQEYVEGDIIAVDVVSNLKYGQVQCCQRKELLRNNNGCGVAVEIVRDTRIEEICMQLVQKMHVNGVINVEFFVSRDFVKIIEINPRLSAGTMFSYKAGLNTVVQAIHIVNGNPCEQSNIQVGSRYAKRYETYQTK